MKSAFTAEFFAGNRRRLRELLKSTVPIVVTANGQLQRSGDSTYPFQQDANFWYLTGVNDPDVLLVMDKDTDYLILPKRSDYQDIFDGTINTSKLQKKSGVQLVFDQKEGQKRLKDLLITSKEVATVAAPPEYIDVYGMYTNPARRRLHKKLKTYNRQLTILDVSKHLVELRAIKQPEELVAIQQAIAVTSQGLQEVIAIENLLQYSHEYEIEADLTRAFRRRGADHAFDPIITGGPRACTLHNMDMSGKIAEDELLLFDVGAAYEGYAADISRTVALQSPSKRQQAVFEAVKDVQAHAYTLLKPGVILKEYEEKIEQCMGKKLRELGLIKTINTDTVRTYFPHATSHHLGLNVHDVGPRTEPLAENMVLTVEPGIYIPEESIGVRIEDDVRITKRGIEILTSALPTKLV